MGAGLFEEIVHHFAESGLASFTPDEDDGLVSFQFQGDSGQWPCFFHVLTDPGRVVLHVVSPAPIPDDRQLEMARLVTRINFGLILGNFELEWGTGELRFRLGVPVDEAAGLSTEVFRTVLLTAITAMDRYFPALMQVGSGVAGAERALAALGE